MAFVVFVGCDSGDTCAISGSVVTGPTVRFSDPQDGLTDLVDHPFPSDALLLSDDLVRLSHFPNPTDSSTLQDFLQVFSTELRGFATSAAIYLGFSESMDPDSFAGDAGAALEDDASVYLVDIDPRSPEQGRRYPLWLRYEDAARQYLPEHHLVALPPFGAALRGGTTYALILTTDVRSSDGASLARSRLFSEAVTPGCEARVSPSLWSAMAPLRAWLQTASDAERVAGATAFTTRDVVGELRSLADAVRSLPPVTATDWVDAGATASSRRYEAQVELPGFQSGRRPYSSASSGGALRRGEDGFQLDHTETTRIVVNVPSTASMPVNGWPVVLYGHGTGGSYRSVLRAEVSEILADNGIASIGYDGTLHGPRDPTGADPALTFFNLFNPVAARDNVRQGAADLVALTEALPSLVVPSPVAGAAVRFDSDRFAFVGHSQGSLVGAPYLAVDGSPRAVVFSGLGAILTITLLERKDIVDFESLLARLLRIPDDDPLDEMHPVVNLFQQFIEPADPIAYARSLREVARTGRSERSADVDRRTDGRGLSRFRIAGPRTRSVQRRGGPSGGRAVVSPAGGGGVAWSARRRGPGRRQCHDIEWTRNLRTHSVSR